jgi:hypothetical protein
LNYWFNLSHSNVVDRFLSVDSTRICSCKEKETAVVEMQIVENGYAEKSQSFE